MAGFVEVEERLMMEEMLEFISSLSAALSDCEAKTAETNSDTEDS